MVYLNIFANQELQFHNQPQLALYTFTVYCIYLYTIKENPENSFVTPLINSIFRGGTKPLLTTNIKMYTLSHFVHIHTQIV